MADQRPAALDTDPDVTWSQVTELLAEMTVLVDQLDRRLNLLIEQSRDDTNRQSV